MTLRATAPGLYDAPLPGLAQGIYRFTLDTGGSDAVSSRGLVAVPYSMEYTPRLAGDTPLGPVAALTGGRVLAAGAPAALTAGG